MKYCLNIFNFFFSNGLSVPQLHVLGPNDFFLKLKNEKLTFLTPDTHTYEIRKVSFSENFEGTKNECSRHCFYCFF